MLRVKNLLFFDICLLAHTQADMQSTFRRLEKYAMQVGLYIGKTKWMRVNCNTQLVDCE